MQRLLDIFRLFKEYVVLAILIILSLLLLNANDNKQIRAIRSYTVGFVGAIQNALSIVPNIFELQRENQTLRQLNVNLSDEVSRLRESRLENIRLRDMLSLQERSPHPLAAADVVGKSLQLLRNTVTLNIGEEQGVKPEMPIISESGLVGKILATSSHYSLGQLLLNRDFRASAKVVRSRVDGIISWDGGSVVRLKNVSKKQDVRTGDIIVTSEYSRIYPRDIKIGVVTSVSETPGSLFRDIDVQPSVDFTLLEQVFVIIAPADSQRSALESKTSGGN